MQVFNGATLLGTATVVAGNWSLDTTLAAGTYNNLKVTVTDLAGNASTTTTAQTIIVDSTPPTESFPTVTLTSDTGTSNSDFITSNGGVHFAGAVADTGGAGIGSVQVFNGATLLGTATVVAGNWSLDTTLAAGTYNNLKVTVTDLAGNASTTTTAQTIIVDSTPPTESFPTVTLTSDTGTSNSDFITSNGGVHFAGAVADTGGAGIGSVQVFNGATLLGTATVVAGNWSLDTTLAAGTYNNLKVTVTDLAGNASTTTTAQTIIVDSTPPSVAATVTALSADTGTAGDFITSVASQTVSGTFTGTLGAGEKIQVSANGGTTWVDATAGSGTWSASGVTLLAGTGALLVQTIDTAGNTTAGTGHSYTLATIGPTAVATVTALSVDTGSSSRDFITDVASQTVSGSFTGTLGAGEKIQVSADGGTTWVDATAGSGTWTASGVTLSAGTGTLLVRTIDTANNTTAGTGHSYTLDQTPPTITGDLGITVNNGSSVVLTTADFHAVDLDNPASQLTFSVTNPTHGYVAFVSAPGAPITSFTEADLEAGSVIFVHDGSATTEATFKVSVSDGALTSAPTTILASVPTVSIVVKTANGMNFQNEDTISALGAGVLQPGGTATTFTLVNVAANRDFVFQGTGFIWTGNILTAGTISVIHELAHDTQTPLVDFTGHIDAPSFYAAAVAQAAGNPSIFDALTSQWIMNFVGGGGNDAFGSNDANDFFKVSGGSDVFDGGFGYDRANYTNATGPIAVQLAVGTVDKRCNAQRYLAVD